MVREPNYSESFAFFARTIMPRVPRKSSAPEFDDSNHDSPELDAEAERIAELMEQTARALFKGKNSTPPKLKPEAMTLTVAQMRCLFVLSHAENCTMRDLSQHLGVRPSTTCELIDGLVRAGMVQREPDPHDRRAVRLKLAPKGRRLKDKHRAKRRDHMRSVVANLSDEQRRAMLGALETLSQVLKDSQQ
jgi:DNA-binding MarR family transcriptional regulator